MFSVFEAPQRTPLLRPRARARVHKLRIPATATLVGAALHLMSAQSAFAQAGPFAPIKPAVCPAWTEVDWTWDGTNADEVEINVNLLPSMEYNNNQEIRANVLGNAWTQRLQVQAGTFNVEPTYDTLSFQNANPVVSRVYGSGTSGWVTALDVSGAPVFSNASLQNHVGGRVFKSDAINIGGPYAGATLTRARVCGNLTTAAPGISSSLDWEMGRRQTGALLGAGDTVYLRYNRSDTTLESSLALWSTAAGTDFDIFVRCNAVPTQFSWDFGTPFSGSSEMLVLPPSYCPGPSTIYVAVNSFSGAGGFNLVMSQRNPSRVMDYRVGTSNESSSVPWTTAEINGISTELRNAARYFWGATEGTTRIRNITLFDSRTAGNCSCGAAACDACYMSRDGRSFTDALNKVWIFRNHRGPELVSHEWGHQLLGLVGDFLSTDEYTDTPSGSIHRCGHSLMGLHWWHRNFCNDIDHGKDYAPGASPYGADSMWKRLYNWGKSPFKPVATPDVHDYMTHPMGGAVGNVTIAP